MNGPKNWSRLNFDELFHSMRLFAGCRRARVNSICGMQTGGPQGHKDDESVLTFTNNFWGVGKRKKC